MKIEPSKFGISCELNKPNGVYSLNDIVSGSFIIQSAQHIEYAHFGYRVVQTISRTNGHQKKEIIALRKRIENNDGSWQSNQRHEYHFKFKPALPTTYDGNHFRIEWHIELLVEARGATRRAFQKEGMRWSVQRLFDTRSSFSFCFPITVETKGVPFRIKPRNENYLFDNETLGYGIGAAVGLIGVVFHWQELFNFAVPIFEIVGSIALGKGVYDTFVGFGKIKEINISTHPRGNDMFDIVIETHRNWTSIEGVKFNYYLQEELDAGDSENSNHKYHIVHNYESHIHPITDKRMMIPLPLPPKDKNLPASFNIHPYSLNWNMVITIFLKNGKHKSMNFHFPLTF